MVSEIIFMFFGATLLTVGLLVGYNIGKDAGKLRKFVKVLKAKDLLPLGEMDPVDPGKEEDPLVYQSTRQGRN